MDTNVPIVPAAEKIASQSRNHPQKKKNIYELRRRQLPRIVLPVLVLALMKLHHGHIAAAKGPANRTEDHVRDSVQGSLVHLVERTIH